MYANRITRPVNPIAAIYHAVRSALTVRLGTPGPARRPTWGRDIHHLGDHILKDIGYIREDRITQIGRGTLFDPRPTSLW